MYRLVCGKYDWLTLFNIFVIALNLYFLLNICVLLISMKIATAQLIQTTVWRKIMASVIGHKAFAQHLLRNFLVTRIATNYI
jgi:hypothetical protein